MPRLVWLALFIALPAAIIAAVMFGATHLPASAVMSAIAGSGEGTNVIVVRELRLPRALLAALVGAGLAASGAAMQGATRNRLAEPYLLGVSGGAAVGAVLALALHFPAYVVPAAAFIGAISAVACTLGVARAAGAHGDPRVVLVAGVVVGAFANAMIMVALSSTDANAVRGALWWMMGSAADATWTQVELLAGFVLVCVFTLFALGRSIDVLALGDDTAAGLGVDVVRTSLMVYVIGALLAAGTVSAAGLIGFVGLLVPHLIRLFGARTHRSLLLGSALGGGALLVIADVLARTLRAPAELPLGAVTALLGVPFFLLLLRRAT